MDGNRTPFVLPTSRPFAGHQSARNFAVRAVHCDFQADDEQVYQALKRATDPLEKAWEKLRNASRIAVKFNQDWVREKVVYYHGQRQQLVSDAVARATLRLLQEKTTAQIYAVDIGMEGIAANITDGSSTNLMEVFREFGVPFVECEKHPGVWISVPGGGLMFERYPLPRPVLEADALVSVQKMKNHQSTGVTLCLKNLFALMSIEPTGRPRVYYHHLIRLPYILADLGRILDPSLCIIDGLVAQAGMEWGSGDFPQICSTLLAGDQAVATDACGTFLMGHDPRADWPLQPFLRDRNALQVAADNGFGTVDLQQIDFQSDVNAPVGKFFNQCKDSLEIITSWRKTACEQALFYRDHQDEFEKQYGGQYILLQMGKVCWSGTKWTLNESRRLLSGGHPEQAIWMKYVEPQILEEEHFEVYEKTLQLLNS
jgi:hypothetical protein